VQIYLAGGQRSFCHYEDLTFMFCMKFILHTVLAFLSSSQLLLAQSGSLKGVVKDHENQVVIPGVSIHLPAEGKGSYTDESGSFFINSLSPGDYEMTFSCAGYNTEILRVAIQDKKVLEVNVMLKRASLQLADIVVSGNNRFLTNTLSAVDIRLRPINSSQDILRMVPGLFIAQHAGGGKAEQIFMRGFDIDHGTDISISVDGMPVNMVSHAHGQGYADLHFVIPELVEKMHFDKGPYFAGYGNLATAGYVSLQTLDFLQKQFVKLEAGDFGSFRSSASIKLLDKSKGDLRSQWYVAGEYLRTDGYFESPQDFNRLNLFTKYTTELSKRTRFSISLSTFSSEWYASGQIPLRAIDRGLITRFGAIDDTEGGNTGRTNVNAKLFHKINDKWSTNQQLFYSAYDFNLYSNFTFFLNYPVEGDGIQQTEKRHVAGYTGAISFDNQLVNNRFQSTLGYGFRYDDVDGSQLNRQQKRNFIEHVQIGDIKELNAFAYWDNNLGFGNGWNLNAAIRYDWFRFGYKDRLDNATAFNYQNRGVVSPKLTLSKDVTQNMKLYASGGIGFHSNDTRVILDKQADDILPRVYGADLGFNVKPMPKLLLKGALWTLHSEQEFVYVGDAGIVEPGGETRRYGAELSARYQLIDWLFADIDLNYTKARTVGAPKGEDYVPLAPVFTSIGGLSAKTKSGFGGFLRYRALGDRPANEDNSSIAEGYFLIDALVNYRWKHFDFSLSAENLLNREWKEAQFDTESRLQNELTPVTEIHFTPGIPRFLKVGVTYIF
jgi:outer membrane receptor protein involved in Fe transport